MYKLNSTKAILWTALSLALGLEIRGDLIRGTPCIKRHHQLFCPTAGQTYPLDRIELFIDENKALMKRMYGEFSMSDEYGPPNREAFGQEIFLEEEDDYDSRGKRGKDPGGIGSGYYNSRIPRQAQRTGHNHHNHPPPPGVNNRGGSGNINRNINRNNTSESGRLDSCSSKIEVVTPYWAANSAGKVRAIVNTQHFEQAIHQEVCSKTQTNRCMGDCGCEQKYKWHRLLAYDPDNDCKGIFMDWFLFPSCCVCRCAPIGK